jgi:hypothetical protein
MDSPPWTVTAFQKARRDTWRAIRIWLLMFVVGMIAFAVSFWLNRSHLHNKHSVKHVIAREPLTPRPITGSTKRFAHLDARHHATRSECMLRVLQYLIIMKPIESCRGNGRVQM